MALQPRWAPAVISRMAYLPVREHLEPAIDPPAESALATNDWREAGARAEFSLAAGFAAAALHTPAAVEDAGDSHGKQNRQRARPARPQSHSQPSARKQTSHDLRHAQPQRQRAQHERQQQGAGAPPKQRTHVCPQGDTRDQARGEKSTTLAHAQAPAHAQDLVPVSVAQGMVGEAVKGMRPPSQPIDPSRQRRRNAGSRHVALGASFTAVP